MKTTPILPVVLAMLIAGCTTTIQPLETAEREAQRGQDAELLKKLSYLGPNPILDLSDVIARAVVFNRDRELASLEARLAGLDSSQAYLDTLPTLIQRFSYTDRTNPSGSTSADIVDGQIQPLANNPSYSTSSDQDSLNSDLTLAVNVLDLSVAALRGETLADQLLIAKEKERQALVTVYQQAQSAYWRAVAADRLQFELDALLVKAREAYEVSLEIQRANLRDPLQNLTYQREILDVERTLRDLKRDLASARTDLDVLIGVLPGTDYVLRESVDPRYPIPADLPTVEDLEALAMLNRADIGENLYQSRILKTERDSLLLQLMPSLSLSASYNKDFSPYVLNDEWGGLGADLSWDFFNLFRVQPTRVRLELRQKLLDEQRLQISVAALALVRQSEALLNQNVDRFALAQQYEQVTGGVFAQVSAAAQAQRQGALSVLKEELNFLVARHRSDLAYSDIHASFGNLVSAAGLDLIPEDWDRLSINELATVVDQRLAVWFKEPEETQQEINVDLPLVEAEPIAQLIAPEVPATKPAATGKGWALQIVTYKSRELALRFKQELESAGWGDLYIAQQGRFYKVRQGPWSERELAAMAIRRLEAEQELDGLIVLTQR